MIQYNDEIEDDAYKSQRRRGKIIHEYYYMNAEYQQSQRKNSI